MGDDHYKFARVALRCKESAPQDEDPQSVDAYNRCMCDGGIPSYCSRVASDQTEPPPETTTRYKWHPYIDFDSLFDTKPVTRRPPPLPESSSSDLSDHMESVVMWLGIIIITGCVCVMIARCRGQGEAGGDAVEGRDAGTPTGRRGSR